LFSWEGWSPWGNSRSGLSIAGICRH